MAFPSVAAYGTALNESVNAASRSISMPSGISAGDILIVPFSIDIAASITSWTAGWTLLGQDANSTVVRGGVFWKVAEGSDSLTVGTQSECASAIAMRISGGNFVSGSFANGSSTNSDPPNHDAVFTKDYLWIVTRHGDAAVVATAAPTNFGDLQTVTGNASGASTNTATYQLNASSLNPGTFTSNTEQWVTSTLAVGQYDCYPTRLTTGADLTDGTTFTTASISPSSNKLILAAVTVRNGASTDPTTPTLSGNGLTWVLVDSTLFDNSGASRRKLFVFRAMGSSPSSGAVTITCGETSTAVDWSISEWTGLDTSGTNGSGAIVQSAVNQDTTATVSTLTATLAAFSSTNNPTYLAAGNGNPGSAKPTTSGSGFAILGDEQTDTTDTRLTTAWKPTNDTTAEMSYSTTGEIGIVAIELKAASAGATLVKDIIGLGMIPFAR